MTAAARLGNEISSRTDWPVLATAPLRPGFDRAALSRYGDASWDLGPAVFRENARRCHITVHFGVVDDSETAEALREYLYARFNVALPGFRPRLPPAGARGAFNRARRFFAFVVGQRGRLHLPSVDQPLLDRYARALRDAGLRPIAVSHLLEVVFDLYALRDYLPTAHLAIEPWPGRTAFSVAGARHRPGENRTPRIPESVISALLARSLRYVELYSRDVLAARAELDQLEARRDAIISAEAGLDDRERRRRQRRRLQTYLDGRRRIGRGVPIWASSPNGAAGSAPATTPVNAHLLHLHVGVDAQAEPRFHLLLGSGPTDLISAAIAKLGIEVGGMDTPITLDPDTGQPWRPRFDTKSLAHEERMLQAAAYLICAYLTGMRDCEVQAMRAGCVSLVRSEDGVIERHHVRSTAYKGRSAIGTPARWVTIAPVARAIEVLETLSRRAAAVHGTDTLWPVLHIRRSGKTHVGAEMVRQLNAFRDHLDALFGEADQPAIPRPDGRTWRLTTRQFRRTIAWHIANRPFGTVAGMIQYKHASVAVFEGYAGSSRSGFRAEVEAERRLGQFDDVLVYFDQRQAGARLSGPAAARVGKALDAAAEALGPLPAMIGDRARLRAALASTARTLHAGILADCFFDPATALCLGAAKAGAAPAPMVALCQPTHCPNACITARHRPAWTRAAEDVRMLLAEKRLGPLQRTALEQERDRLGAILTAIDPAG